MMFHNLCLTVKFLILSSIASDLFGGFILTLGTTPLANNSADARLPVYLQWDGLGDNPPIFTMQLTARIGTGDAGQTGMPKFRVDGSRGGVLFVDGATPADQVSAPSTVWQLFPPPTSTGGFSPVTGNVYLTANVTITDLPTNVGDPKESHQFSNAVEKVAEFRINTSGIENQRFDFAIGQFSGGSSFLTDGNNNQYTISLTNGSFDVGNVSAVPEPGSVTLAMLACAGAVGVNRRRAWFTQRRGEGGETLIQ